MREARTLSALAALALAVGLSAMARTEISTPSVSARDLSAQRQRPPPSGEARDAGLGEAARALRDGEPIDLNGASAAELELLPGIGPTLAARIVAHRAAEGRFESLESLEAVRGVGPRALSRIRDLVTIER